MAELDDAFANAAYIPGADAYPDRWAQAAETFRQALGDRYSRRSYGAGARNWFDMMEPARPRKGTLIFVHGGYWLRFDASFWSHFAQGALARGWAVAMPSYDLCPDVSIAQITDQIAAAVETIAWQTNDLLTLAGHSAGGHLVGRMLAPGLLMPETLARIAHVVPISPVADLRPLLRTSMNDAFKLDMIAAEAESPVLQPVPETPVAVWVGAEERPVFVQQARALASAWSCEIVETPGEHHFNVIDALADPGSRLAGVLSP